MDKKHEILLSLVRLGIGKGGTDIDFSQEMIPETMALAKTQEVDTIVADGISKLCNSQILKLEKDCFFKLYNHIFNCEKQYRKHVLNIVRLNSFLKSHGIDMMVIKGYCLSLNYPVPSHRHVGDLDSWHFGKGKEADRLIEKEFGIPIDRSNKRHSSYTFNATFVENHLHFFDKRGHYSNKSLNHIVEAEATIDKCSRTIESSNGAENELLLPSTRFNSLFVLRHSACHFAAQGISLRHILDWGFFVEKHHDEINWTELESIAGEYGMTDFLLCQNAVCIDYLGFDEDCFAGLRSKGELVERFLGDVFVKEYDYTKTGNKAKDIMTRFRRWKGNEWKFKMVYNENRLVSFIRQSIAHLLWLKSFQQ